MESRVELTESDAEDAGDGRLNFEIQPYQETKLPGGWVVYHQGDEEQNAITWPNGQIELRGPHDWTVAFEVQL